ncbi:hypothetical protein MYOV011v1_p0342 [Vibrio phage 6E35.1a]|nr:hypothetical protein MYOV011v1_p0342 [Vibrio phage 6E35.1a]
MHFSIEQLDQIENNYRVVDTINVGERKGSPQAKYVIEITKGDYWHGGMNEMQYVDDELVGHWILEYATDPYWDGVDKCVKTDEWTRAVEVTVTTWVAADEV